MKSYCKNIDITDEKFIEAAIWDCLTHRDRKDFGREDIQRIIAEYGTIDVMARKMSQELKERKLNLPPVRHDIRRDKSNGKLREIDIEDIWQQYYDYVAARALEPALAMLGYYQCGCVEGKGQVWGMQMLHGGTQKYRFFTHSDIRKCYPSIPQRKLFRFLKKHIKNDLLLWLIETLVTHTTKTGISIGSRLSITLCQLYLSQIYHHITQDFCKYRRGKRIQIIPALLIFMDDIYMASNSTSNLHKGERELARYAQEELGIYVKPDWTMVDTQESTLDCMGFRTQHDYTKMRRQNYEKTKRALRSFKNNPNIGTAQNLTSRTGNVRFTDSYHFRKKYQWKQTARQARRLISNASKIHRETRTAGNLRGWQYDLLPDRAQSPGSGGQGPGDRGDA